MATELSFQRAQRAKREAAERSRRGDADRARGVRSEAATELYQLDRESLSAELADEIDAQGRAFDELAEQAATDAASARKRAVAGHRMKSRKRGRRG